MAAYEPTLFAEDFIFLEAPRWRDGELWVSDVFDEKVYRLGTNGSRAVVCEVPHRPSGLGFMPDGTPIVASARDRKLMKIVGRDLVVHADLSSVAAGDVNDFAIDECGRIYVGNFGYDFHGGAPSAAADLHVVDSDGGIRVAASGLEFANGTLIMNGGRTLVVAETWCRRLTAFDRDSDGHLSNRRIYADLGTREPDGICVDAEGGVWACCFNTGEVIRVLDGGTITNRIKCSNHAISCQLGGADRKTLFCTVYTGTLEDMGLHKRLAAVYAIRVDIPGATEGLNMKGERKTA